MIYADVAQLAEQLICNQQVIGSSPIIGFQFNNTAGWSSLEARRAHNPKVTGSNPVPAIYAQIAQLVEQRTENPRVAGSIPALGIIFLSVKRISMCKILFQLQKTLAADGYVCIFCCQSFYFRPSFFLLLKQINFCIKYAFLLCF